jgi:hypothetical protein
VGLAAPAAAQEAGHLISGASIRPHSISGDRFAGNTVTGKRVEESTLGVVSNATRADAVTALVWHPLTLSIGWSDPITGGRAPAYAIDAQGVVHFRGYLESPATPDTTIFTLPPSLIPENQVCLALGGAGTVTGRLLIDTDGAVSMVRDPQHSTASASASLDGVTWAP